MALADLAAKVSQKLSGALNRYSLTVEGGAAALDVESFSGEEFLSRGYRYVITFTSRDSDISPQQMLLKNATFSFNLPGTELAGFSLPAAEPRAVHGVVTQFQRLSSSVDETRYQATLEPRLALLGNASRPAIFQNQSVPEIVEQVLRDTHQFEGWQFDFRLRNRYPRREQVMQWQESDLAFIERLLSEVGIWYRFEADSRLQQEIVVFADDQQFCQFDVRLPLRALSGMNDSASESVWKLSAAHQVVSKSVQVKDYNYREAGNGLLSHADVTGGDETTYGEVYRYGDNYLTQGENQDPAAEAGAFYARLRHERLLNARHQLHGESNCVRLQPGQMLEIAGAVPQSFSQGVIISGISSRGGRDSSFSLAFHGIPYSETVGFRPALKPRPTIAGTLQARVTSVTENDRYAHLDESGRYRVKFDFDLARWKSGYESLWVRLAKPYSGDTYGLHMPLVAGAEVAIAFEEGNPDRPYIAYALHNSRSGDHVTAANHKRNVLRTPANNKLRMEDERGKEHIKLSTEYGGKSQLNLGHLVDGQRQPRGEGFELRSDQWGAIRAGKGLFLSADAQPKGQGQALDMQAAVAQLENALSLAKSLSQAAASAQATAGDTDSQQALNEALDALNQPGMLMHAPEGMGMVSPKAVRVASGGASVGIMSGQNTDISSGKSFTASAGESVSLFARKAGMKLFAGKGKVDIQAQGDAMNLLAKEDVSITSVNNKVTVSAYEELLLTCGGGYIRLKDGNIEIGGPNNILLKSQNVQKMGAANIEVLQPELPVGYSGGYVLTDDNTGEPQAFTAYRITTAEGEVFEGTSDKDGNTMEINTASPGTISIEFPDELPEEGPGRWVTIDNDYHGLKNSAILAINRLTSMGDEGRVFGSDGKDYQNTKRDKIQQWKPLKEGAGDEMRQRSAIHRYGDKRIITQTYLEGEDSWAVGGKSWHWQPVTADEVYAKKDPK